MSIQTDRVKNIVAIWILVLFCGQLLAQQNNIIPPPLHIKTIEFKPAMPLTELETIRILLTPYNIIPITNFKFRMKTTGSK